MKDTGWLENDTNYVGLIGVLLIMMSVTAGFLRPGQYTTTVITSGVGGFMMIGLAFLYEEIRYTRKAIIELTGEPEQ